MKKTAERLQYEHIQELKETTVATPRVEVNQEEDYKVRIINRGEQLFYQQENRALICEIQPTESIVYTDSIKRWDDGKPVTDEEKRRIITRLDSYFKKYQEAEAKFV